MKSNEYPATDMHAASGSPYREAEIGVNSNALSSIFRGTIYACILAPHVGKSLAMIEYPPPTLLSRNIRSPLTKGRNARRTIDTEEAMRVFLVKALRASASEKNMVLEYILAISIVGANSKCCWDPNIIDVEDIDSTNDNNVKKAWRIYPPRTFPKKISSLVTGLVKRVSEVPFSNSSEKDPEAMRAAKPERRYDGRKYVKIHASSGSGLTGRFLTIDILIISLKP